MPDDKLNAQLATLIKEKYNIQSIFVILRGVEVLERYREALNKAKVTAVLVNELVVSEITNKLRPGGWSTVYLNEQNGFEIVKAIVYEDSKALGKKVQEFNITGDSFIVAIVRDGNILRAKDNFVLESGDEVFIAGKKTSVETLLEYF
ncbi:MAG: TrkA C-terminal domain-containing protein [Thermoproteota archaeon]